MTAAIAGPPLELGLKPQPLDVNLMRGSGFNPGVLHRQDESAWPAGSSFTLVFDDGTQWPAELDGPDASWDISAAAVATLITANPSRAQIVYIEPGSEPIVAYHGRVHIL